MDTVDISEPVATICETLGLDVNRVCRLDLEPGRAKAVVFRENEHGSPYIDTETGEAAQDTFEFKARM